MELSIALASWLILGGIAGWTASQIMGERQRGVLPGEHQRRGVFWDLARYVAVGVVGGVLGGVLLTLFGVDVEGGGLIFSFLTCLLGAVIVLWLFKLVAGRR